MTFTQVKKNLKKRLTTINQAQRRSKPNVVSCAERAKSQSVSRENAIKSALEFLCVFASSRENIGLGNSFYLKIQAACNHFYGIPKGLRLGPEGQVFKVE